MSLPSYPRGHMDEIVHFGGERPLGVETGEFHEEVLNEDLKIGSNVVCSDGSKQVINDCQEIEVVFPFLITVWY